MSKIIKLLMKWCGLCTHNYEVIHHDTVVSVERCKHCGNLVHYYGNC